MTCASHSLAVIGRWQAEEHGRSLAQKGPMNLNYTSRSVLQKPKAVGTFDGSEILKMQANLSEERCAAGPCPSVKH